MQKTQAIIERATPLTDTILQLSLAPHTYIDYQAGQYLQILLDEELLSYSIANAPLGSHKYELHIRHARNNLSNQRLLATIKQAGAIDITLPHGTCHIKALDPQKPIIFIAAGTGFAPIKAMIEQLLTDGNPRPFELYWGARSQSDLYMDEKVLAWKKHVAHFDYFSMISTLDRHGLASQVLENHSKDMNDWQLVLSGPFEMVYETRDLLVQRGIQSTHLFSDAFSFEK